MALAVVEFLPCRDYYTLVKGLSQITPGAHTASKIMTQIADFTRRTGPGTDL